MNFDFTDDQQSLRDAVRRWVDKDFPFTRRHALAKAGGKTRPVLAELGALGLTALAVAPEHGGLGLGPVDAMVVQEELGRGLVNAPYAQAALLAPALLSQAPAALQAAWLPKIADASALVVVAHQELPARYRLERVAMRATRQGALWRVDGAKSVVAAGDEADAWLLAARTDGGAGAAGAADIALFLVERHAEGVAVRGYPTQDGARAAELVFTAAPAALVSTEGLAALLQARDIGIGAACAEGVGLMERLLDMTTDYLRTRRQFGASLASFQALRHRVADIKMQLELARSMSYLATLSLGQAPLVRRRALSQAKVQLGQSMRFVGQQCIQLHGGIGVTDDYAASHCFKRLTVLETSFGDTLHHLGEVGALMQDSAGLAA